MRALISVFDKTGVVDFARGLVDLGVEVFSTGGTEALLRENGVAVKSIQELTSFPEILGGRVKTLHPLIHAGILAIRGDPVHAGELEQAGAELIDIVVNNLYPFREIARRSSQDLSAVLEGIDIGGGTLLRAAAKNFPAVIPLCDPMDYSTVLDALQAGNGGLSQSIRRRLAAKAFQHCAAYDTHIAGYLRTADELFPDELTLAMTKIGELRYGENPHQLAAFYADSTIRNLPRGVVSGRQLHGKQLSFNNTYDLDAAWRIVADFSAPTVALVKHGNPCGLACGDDLAETYRRALAADPQSAFGGAVAINRTLDEATAREIAEVFFEDLIAPDYEPRALEIIKTSRSSRNMRVMATGYQPERPGELEAGDLDLKRVVGGWLVQTRDALPENMLTRDVVTTRPPTLAELTSLLFAWRAVKHVHSNGIVLARGLQMVGMGAGQPSRVDAVDIAVRKAADRASGSVMASDAFFPFPDGIERAAMAGVTAVIHPGGSIRDQQAIEVANRHHMAMIFTHQRHFKH